MNKGICYGVSAGPGDPELMTLKAVNIIINSDIIFLPSAPKEKCRVYQIIKAALPEIDEKKYVCVDTAGMADPRIQGERYDILAKNVMKYLDEGKNVAFPALGEVCLYSTYMYVCDRLIEAGYNCENISGISSVQETANRMLVTLAKDKEQVHVFPDADCIEDRLNMPGTKVFMKPRNNLKETVEAIRAYADANPSAKAYGISNCGTDMEIMARSLSELDELSGYMTVIIVK